MKFKFVFVGALIGALVSFGLNPAMSAPRADSANFVSHHKTKQKNKKAASTSFVKKIAYSSVPASRAALKAGKAKAVRKKAAKSLTDNAYSSLITHYANVYGVSPALAHAVVRHESNFQPNIRGKAGEIGLMQIKLETARYMGYTGTARGLYEPATNIQYGMKYLAMAQKLSDGSTCGTILKYNAGHGAKRMNPISAKYCSQVKLYMQLM
ncbi:lytic transglycosylase domain-containing protein [Daeguia caeni]|uniref:Lytic transglycosylase domain-containing protein n=1 Tax=Daeguia caeni TaxID=439612 RepID=A0ABV9H3N8_9HYPH